MYQITIQPDNISFNISNPEETILQAALRNGFVVPYGCKNGACGSCKASIVNGEVDYGTYQKRALSEGEKNNNHLLLCTAIPITNVTIKANLISMNNTNVSKKLPCRVEQIKKVASDVALVKLKLPANEKFDFLPGQYIDILLKDGKRRSYSMANAPNEKNIIELHIKHTPGGAFTDSIFSEDKSTNHIKEKDILRLEGPLGTFYLRNDLDNLIFLASGTGIAPIKAIFEQLINTNFSKKIQLYWGVRKPQDLYIHDLVRSWATQLNDFTYVPVISEAGIEDNWNGRTGFVHNAVIKDFPNLKDYKIYACGAPIMINAALKDFVNLCNLPKENFYSDAFTTAADK